MKTILNLDYSIWEYYCSLSNIWMERKPWN